MGLALAIAGGCGFVGEPTFEGRRPTGDVAPWSDLGPVTFCDGALRLGPPDAAGLGLCVADGAPPPRPCARDADCGSRERCTCGGCQVPACSSGDECPAGWQCTFAEGRCDRTCARASDCAPGERCARGDGVCRGACQGDGDCQSGEACDGDTCVTRRCSGGGGAGGCAVGTCRVQRVAGELREPSPLVVGGRVVVWLERIDAAAGQPRAAVWRALSDDGRRFRFDPTTPVLVDGARAGAPTLLARAGGLLLVYATGAGELKRATSPSLDGVAFTVDATPLARPSAPFEASGLDAPALAPDPRRAGALVLYYGTTDGSAIGVGESADGVVFTRRATPVLRPSELVDARLWTDVDRVASPFAEAAAGPDGAPFLRLFFAAHGRESGPSMQFGALVPETPNWSIGAAHTVDGATLSRWPFNPVFDRVKSFLDHLSESDPAVISVDGRRLLYYRGAGADGTHPTNLGAAASPPPDPPLPPVARDASPVPPLHSADEKLAPPDDRW